MSWNYRVVERTVDGETFFAIHEHYPPDDEPGHRGSITTNPCHPQGATRGELHAELLAMLDAIHKPTLEYSYFDDEPEDR